MSDSGYILINLIWLRSIVLQQERDDSGAILWVIILELEQIILMMLKIKHTYVVTDTLMCDAFHEPGARAERGWP